MALRWIVHTACNALGYDQNQPNIHCKEAVGYQNQVHPHALLNNTSKVIATNSSSSSSSSGFQMPLHYPRYSKADYQKMEEWKVDMLLREYGLTFQGTLDQKRAYAMGTFLWPDQY
ncbi:uncharacterized protein LOC123218586 [Mangifera indica]|uniref:uncharacterized protein LOC123218586 n=1 Tax=Mangifera indica TaxID=29780 RepID=UPI001CF9D209|nr:uncharacterized protein LOC123218586 [Mangifera indica]